MTINTATKLEAHPPLARDSFGNLVAIPDRTSAWRICRETTGRPREIRGPDRQAIRFPLETTTEDLVELCGAGAYRIYALDEVGAQLEDEHVAKWDLTPGRDHHHRNGATDAPLLTSLRPSSGVATVTDLRFALEAMTQMMRTNSEALRIVTDSHVDLAKTIVSAKGLRNATLLATPLAIESADDLDDDDKDGTPTSHPIVELLMPFAQKAADMMPGLVMGKVMVGAAVPADAKALASGDATMSSDDAGLADRPRFELRDLVDLQYAKQKGDAKRAAKQPSEQPHAAAMASLQAKIIADPALVQQLIAIKEQLAADEVETLMKVVGSSSEAQQAEFIAAIKALPREAAVEFCRDVVTAIHTRSAQ